MLVLAAVTALVGSGFLVRAARESRLAARSFHQNSALNLAEAGLEEALWAANSSGFTSANGWTVPADSASAYVKSVTTGLALQDATGAIYIRVDSAATSAPTVTAAGVITIPNQPRIVKQLRLATTRSSLWSNGLVSKGAVTFSGAAGMDAYDSAVGAYNASTNRLDTATLGCLSSTVTLTGSATIYGYVATAGAAPVIGASGRIYGATSPATPLVDSSRVRTDFAANLPDAVAPTGPTTSLGNINGTVTLPRGGDVAGANGRYLYSASKLDLDGNATLTINGPVDIISAADATLTGSAQIVLNSGSTVSLNLYCPTTIALNGAGMVNNTGNTAKSTIWGTAVSPATQAVTVGGSSAFVGTLYTPNGDVALSGSGGVYGAVIGRTVNVGGSADFHYDTQLGNVGASGYFRLSAWAELTGSPTGGSVFARDNRAPFASLF